MKGRLRAVKSEVNNMYHKRKTQVMHTRTRTPLRFSRRLRQLPPEVISFYDNVRNHLRKERLDPKHIISRESSTFIRPCQRHNRSRRLHYPQRIKNSKEVISILSAPKICNKKNSNAKKFVELPTQVRGSSCRPKMIKDQVLPFSSHTILKNIKKEHTETEKLLEKRKKYVLEILNKGDMRDIRKLPSVGSKTAERIIFYRQLKGSINNISELAKMPKFPKQKYNNFVEQNFLKWD